MQKTLKIRELDLDIIRPCTNSEDETGSKIAVIGKPGSGKSFLIRDLLYSKKHIFPTGKVVSGTEDSNKFFSSMFPDLIIDEKLTMGKIRNFIMRQKVAKEHLGKYAWSYLVLDDCMDDPSLFRDPIFQNLLKNGRHWKLLLILGMQYAMDVLPGIRICIDGTFIFREANIRNRKVLFENYAGIFGDFKLFCKVMDEITDDFTCLYIDNRTTSNKIEDCVYFYRARTIEPFQIGCEDFWLFHEERYDPEYTPVFV